MQRFRKLIRLCGGSAILAAVALALGGCEISDEPSPKQASATAVPSAATETASATDIRFVAGFQRGYEQAIAQGKPMLVFFTGKWCRYCREMAAETLSDPEVSRLSERFVCIAVDADDEPHVCEQFQVGSYPTIQLISRRGEPLARLVGKRSAAAVLRHMQAALDAVARAENSEDVVR